MFHLILTVTYLIPGIYLFIRIRQLFIEKKHRLRYTVIFILLALIYPSGNLLDEGVPGFIGSFLRIASGYLLPFFLYLFLFVLLLDILLVLNLIFKIVPGERLKEKGMRKAGLAVITGLSVLVVAAGIINFNTIRVTDYKIAIPRKSSDLATLKVAYVSDFHLKEGVRKGFVERFVKKIDEIKPDIMLFGGDIVEGDRDDGDLQAFEGMISTIKTKYGVYGVLGNHEHYAGQDKGGFFTKAGIDILRDTVIKIDEAFMLAGRNDSHVRARKSLNDLLGNQNDSLPLILLDHRPSEYDQISRTRTDVVISGHTHHGQLFPINFSTRRIYPLSYGHRQIGNTHFFVSSGIRLWGPPVRTVGRSEIVVIDINMIGN